MQQEERYKKIGRNIYYLRQMYGETGLELALAIGASSSGTISNYENGTRIPKREILDNIAYHYRITVEELLNEDFGNVDFKKAVSNEDAMKQVARQMFPIICSDKALDDKCFYRGYMLHKKMFDGLENNIVDEIGYVECVNHYINSLKLNRTPESAGNLLNLVFLSWISIYCASVLEKYEKYKRNGRLENLLKETWLREYDQPISNEQKKERRVFLEDNSELIRECVLILKESVEWCQLADYYIMMRYLFSLVDNEHDDETNNMIGSEMMTVQLELKNPYVYRYYKAIQENF